VSSPENSASGSIPAIAQRIPASFFAIVMGLGGLGYAWRTAGRTYPVLAPFGEALVLLAAALWMLLASAYIAKWASAPAAARSEWTHPVQAAFVAIIPASLLLLLPALEPRIGVTGPALFFLLACVQVVVTAAMFARWISGRAEPATLTPAWHLAAVAGHLFAAGAAAAFGYKLTGWCFFGAGILAWIIIDSIVLHRLATHEPLAPALRPLIAIEVAPPAVALIVYLALGDGEADALALGLFGWGLFVAVVLAILWRWLCEAPFGPAYWAFTLPVAALSMAAWRIAHATAAEPALYFALALFLAANALIGFIAWRTVTALARGRFVPLGAR
jgi:tellurite resistance protein